MQQTICIDLAKSIKKKKKFEKFTFLKASRHDDRRLVPYHHHVHSLLHDKCDAHMPTGTALLRNFLNSLRQAHILYFWTTQLLLCKFCKNATEMLPMCLYGHASLIFYSIVVSRFSQAAIVSHVFFFFFCFYCVKKT